MSVTLREVTRANWRACSQLRLAPEQEPFVASNLYSLAESKFEPDCVPLAIYSDDTMVGFVMYGRDPADGQYWIYRLMIDQAQQGQGYGRAALRQVIGTLAAQPDCDTIALSYHPDNAVAERLYLSEGFAQSGEMLYGEIVARRPRP